jgi:uncharacterized protein (DUF1697 family)
MPRYIAFLRAINVGGHVVKMDYLRKLFEALGFEHVESFIASGNVIFDAPEASGEKLEKQIERHLRQALGYEVATFLRSPAELEAIASYKPFAASEINAEGRSLNIAFLAAPPVSEARDKLLALRNDIDAFAVHEREVYWLRRPPISESRFTGAMLEKTLGMPATVRNVTTVRKLAAKYASSR